MMPGEVLGLGVNLLAQWVRGGERPTQVPYRYFDGPDSPPAREVRAHILSWDDILGTCLYEDAYLDTYHRMTPQVRVGRNWLAPADFAATIGVALPRWLKGDTSDVPVLARDLAQAAYVPEHVPWDWLVFPPGFNGDPLLELGRLQSWTLKPASLT
jgi:hypothetical protein